MHPADIISRRINKLFKLPDTKESIHITDLRKEYRQDLENFIVGETLGVKDGKMVIGKNLYRKWLQKLKTRGFDYDIEFR